MYFHTTRNSDHIFSQNKLISNNILSLFLSRKKIYIYSNATNIFYFANIALKWENFFQKSFLKRTSGGTILLSAAYYPRVLLIISACFRRRRKSSTSFLQVFVRAYVIHITDFFPHEREFMRKHYMDHKLPSLRTITVKSNTHSVFSRMRIPAWRQTLASNAL